MLRNFLAIGLWLTDLSFKHLGLFDRPANPELDGRTFQGVAERRLEPVAAVGLLTGTAHVHLGYPFVPQAQTEPAHHRAVGQTFIIILPSFDPEDFIQAILNSPGIDIR